VVDARDLAADPRQDVAEERAPAAAGVEEPVVGLECERFEDLRQRNECASSAP
jgi:hypothetical protein